MEDFKIITPSHIEICRYIVKNGGCDGIKCSDCVFASINNKKHISCGPHYGIDDISETPIIAELMLIKTGNKIVIRKSSFLKLILEESNDNN